MRSWAPSRAWGQTSASGCACGSGVEGASSRPDQLICAAMALPSVDVPDAAVSIHVVVPMHVRSCPGPSGLEVCRFLGRKVGAVLVGLRNKDSA